MQTYGDSSHDWRNLAWDDDYKLALVTKAGVILECTLPGAVYVCELTGHIQAKFKKAHWAKGRVIELLTNLPGVASGEYMILDKEGWTYGYDDILRLKRHIPVLDTARKANNWAEKQERYQEMADSLTAEKIKASLKS